MGQVLVLFGMSLQTAAWLAWAALYRRTRFVHVRLKENAPGTTDAKLSEMQLMRAAAVARVLSFWHRRSPITLNCLTLALAGQQLLKRSGVPSRLQISVKVSPETGALCSHAWLYAGGRIVAGGLPDPSFRPIWSQECH